MTGEEPEQERSQTVAAATAAAVAAVTGRDETEETCWVEYGERKEKHEAQQHQQRKQQQQHHHHQQPQRTLVDQLTYSKMAHLLAIYQNKVRVLQP